MTRSRAYAPGHTNAAGLGWAHQQARARAIAALRDGEPCPRCGRPMLRALAKYLDLDDFPGRRFGGPQVKMLSHRSCNRRAGQRVTMAIRAARRQARYTRW